MSTRLLVTPKKIATVLSAVVGVLLLANLVCIYLKFVRGNNFQFIRTFYFNTESNIPSLYSSLAIIACAFALFQISGLRMEIEKRRHFNWKILGYVFLFLGVDEFVSIHENLTGVTRRAVGDGAGYLHYAWVLPYVIVFLGVFGYMARFFFRLPNWLKLQFLAAGSIFVFGAVGVEMMCGKYEAENGTTNTLTYALLATLEELLEMVGIILFMHALLRYYVENVAGNLLKVSVEMHPGRREVAHEEKGIPEVVQ
jgi:hypothetical protein